MRKLRKTGLLLGLMVVMAINSSVSWGFDIKDIQNIKLPDPFGFFEPQYSIRLYNSVALENEMVKKLLRKYQPGFSNEKLANDGYAFPLPLLAGRLNIKRPGIVSISDQGIEYDQIGSMVFNQIAATGINHLEFTGKKRGNEYADFQYILDRCFIINVDETFIKKHAVRVHKVTELPLANAPDDLLPKVEQRLFLQMRLGKLDFVNKKASAATLRRKLAENFVFKVYHVPSMGRPKVLIACFEPKEDQGENTYNKFCCLMVNGRICRYGFLTDFIAFGIDKQNYLEFLNELVPGSGNIGKALYTFDGSKLKLVQQDYSYTD